MANRSAVATTGPEFVSLREAMDRLVADSFVGGPFQGLWSGGSSNGNRAGLPLDVYATNDAVTVYAAIPGLGPEDVEISVNQGTVTISGELPNAARSEEAQGATWYLHELGSGSFQRSVTLPVEIESTKADATIENGVLRLHLPKADRAKPRQIKIRASRGGDEAALSEGEQKS